MKGLNKNYQALIFSFLVALLIITPILSSSIRSTYLYFIINLVIIALGAESGLLSFVFSKPPPPPADHQDKAIDDDHTHQPKTIQKSVSEKVTSTTTVRLSVKKSPSMPSIFFIGGGGETEASLDGEGDTVVEEQDEELVGGGGGGGGVNGQDQLFTKAENFIGNFYKQLKMQRQDSWNRIHGFYQKAF